MVPDTTVLDLFLLFMETHSETVVILYSVCLCLNAELVETKWDEMQNRCPDNK